MYEIKMTNCEKEIKALDKEWQEKLDKELQKRDKEWQEKLDKELQKRDKEWQEKLDKEMNKLINVLKKNNIHFKM